MSLSSNELRKLYIDFFAKKKHKVVKSAPLLPANDPTLLFVNAGMVQFKDVFIGRETKDYSRAVSSQKCVRAGGKHNDLENVGRTARHHTFFEMLGNFSFGDYFKKEACLFAWEFLTQVVGLNKNRLSVTVFGGEGNLPADEEAADIWHNIVGVPKKQISKKGMKDNFWAMGETGPCGPCTEIHYDRRDITSGFSSSDELEDEQILEVWNLVFMEYERKKDGSLVELPAKCVDTGMGLERLATVVNNLPSNYDTDLLKPLIDFCADKINKKYTSSSNDDDVSMRIIADHSRTCAFLIADGILPANEGRGYVLRRIMRRAIRHGAKLGFNKMFFNKICLEVVRQYKNIYPELQDAKALIDKVVQSEEESFRKTLNRGLQLFEKTCDNLGQNKTLDGKIVFQLHETYGFPTDLTKNLADEKNIVIDWPSYDKAKLEHAEISGHNLGLAGIDDIFKDLLKHLGPTKFLGYEKNSCKSKVLAILDESKKQISSLRTNNKGYVILDQTCFYGESGGQIGDSGQLTSKNGIEIKVHDTKKFASLIVHFVEVKNKEIKIGDSLISEIDQNMREDIKKHHSATHLLHSALKLVLGNHVTQKGSLVCDNRLRFDFAHFEAISKEQIMQIENLVNQWIFKNSSTVINEMSLENAKSAGAVSLFGEKYADKVRVVQIGNSKELCGGTHVKNSAEIGLFKISEEGPLAAGIRRLEAVCGAHALSYINNNEFILEQISQKLKTNKENLLAKISSIANQLKDIKQQLKQFQQKQSSLQAAQNAQKAKIIDGVKIIAEIISFTGNSQLRDYADKLKDRIGSGIIVLGAKINDKKCMILVMITKDLDSKYHAGKIISKIAPIVDGKGGGKANFAQAGGSNPDKLENALSAVEELL